MLNFQIFLNFIFLDFIFLKILQILIFYNKNFDDQYCKKFSQHHKKKVD